MTRICDTAKEVLETKPTREKVEKWMEALRKGCKRIDTVKLEAWFSFCLKQNIKDLDPTEIKVLTKESMAVLQKHTEGGEDSSSSSSSSSDSDDSSSDSSSDSKPAVLTRERR